MTLRDFIRENRTEIDAFVHAARDRVPRTASCYCLRNGTDHMHDGEPLNDRERREWVLNDEGLYRWARREGVRI